MVGDVEAEVVMDWFRLMVGVMVGVGSGEKEEEEVEVVDEEGEVVEEEATDGEEGDDTTGRGSVVDCLARARQGVDVREGWMDELAGTFTFLNESATRSPEPGFRERPCHSCSWHLGVIMIPSPCRSVILPTHVDSWE